MTALTRMRLYAYLRTGRFVAPVLTCLVVIGIYYGGGGSDGAAPAAELSLDATAAVVAGCADGSDAVEALAAALGRGGAIAVLSGAALCPTG